MNLALRALLKREMRLLWRQRGEMASALLFSLLTITLFPFTLSPEPELLQRLAPGLLNLTMVLAQLMGFERLFLADWQEGTLDLLALSQAPLSLYAFVKTVAHWFSTCLPLLVISPLYMLLLHVPANAMPAILLSLFLGSTCFALLGAGASALSLGARRAGIILPLLLIPFYCPALIFSVQLATSGLGSGEGRQAALFLSALICLYLPLIPFLAGAALRSAIESA